MGQITIKQLFDSLFYTVESLQKAFAEHGITMHRQTIISRCTVIKHKRLTSTTIGTGKRATRIILKTDGDRWIQEEIKKQILQD